MPRCRVPSLDYFQKLLLNLRSGSPRSEALKPKSLETTPKVTKPQSPNPSKREQRENRDIPMSQSSCDSVSTVGKLLSTLVSG